jgi:hypothetical protein
MTETPDAGEAPVDETKAQDDRTLRRNEVAIVDVRSEVASAVEEIDRALDRLREVLTTRLPELRLPEEGPRP